MVYVCLRSYIINISFGGQCEGGGGILTMDVSLLHKLFNIHWYLVAKGLFLKYIIQRNGTYLLMNHYM